MFFSCFGSECAVVSHVRIVVEGCMPWTWKTGETKRGSQQVTNTTMLFRCFWNDLACPTIFRPNLVGLEIGRSGRSGPIILIWLRMDTWLLRRKLFYCKSKASFRNRSCRPGCVVDALSVVGDLEFQDILGQTSITDESELTCSSIGVTFCFLSFGKGVAPNDASFRSNGGSRQHSMLHVAACLLPQSPHFHHVSLTWMCISL